MRLLPSLLIVSICLAGCAGRRAPAAHGNFIDVPATLDENVMADDVARKMAMLYPPAHTSIKMQQATPDAFGAALAAALRSQGYAFAEFNPRAIGTGPASGTPVRASNSDNLAVAYLVDQPLDSGMYRVTVLINEQSLSRLYQAKDGSVAPAGYWVRKE
jgi:hypothetical protein